MLYINIGNVTSDVYQLFTNYIEICTDTCVYGTILINLETLGVIYKLSYIVSELVNLF